MVGVLVLDRRRGQDDGRTQPPDHAGQADRVGGLLLEVGVAVELDELQRRAEHAPRPGSASSVRSSGVPWVADSPREQTTRCAGRPARVSSGDDAAAAELDVVGMSSRRPAGAPAQVGGST